MKKPIFVLGDIHGSFDVILRWRKTYDIQNAIIIQVGDFGIGFGRNGDIVKQHRHLRTVNEVLARYNVDVYVVRGNHDNPDYFNGTVNLYELTQFHFMKDYQVQDIEGYKFLFIGGAISVDRVDRVEGINWWKKEELVYDPNKVKDLRGIDCIISHSAPSFCPPISWGTFVYECADKDPGLHYDLPNERKQLKELFDIVDENNYIQHYFYGHFHFSAKHLMGATDFHLLAINEFKQIIFADTEINLF